MENWLLPREYACLHEIDISEQVSNNYQKNMKNDIKTHPESYEKTM